MLILKFKLCQLNFFFKTSVFVLLCFLSSNSCIQKIIVLILKFTNNFCFCFYEYFLIFISLKGYFFLLRQLTIEKNKTRVIETSFNSFAWRFGFAKLGEQFYQNCCYLRIQKKNWPWWPSGLSCHVSNSIRDRRLLDVYYLMTWWLMSGFCEGIGDVYTFKIYLCKAK